MHKDMLETSGKNVLNRMIVNETKKINFSGDDVKEGLLL